MAGKQIGFFDDTPVATAPKIVDIVWHVMVPTLKQFTSEQNARRIIGKLVKQRGREAVIVAFDKLTHVSPFPADPIPYLIKLANSNEETPRSVRSRPAPASAAQRAQQAILERRASEGNQRRG